MLAISGLAIFGGIFLGAGIGFDVRGGAVIDSTEVLVIFLSKKMRTALADIIIVINAIIFSSAAYLLSIEIVLYSGKQGYGEKVPTKKII